MNLSNEIVSHIQTEKQEFLQFKKLQKYSDIVTHAYAIGITKNYRTFQANKTPLAQEDYQKNMGNYKSLCEANFLNDKNLIKANQAHTDKIIKVEKIENTEKIDIKENCDGLVTNQKNIILATTNADCILLLLFDPVKRVIANVHSGWKGTLQEISVKAVNKMKEEFGCNPQDIIVCFCPSIRKCHFEVDKEVYEMFYQQFKKLGNIEDFIEEKNQKWYIDTVYINKIILQQAGIQEENMEDCGICSVCHKDQIHSFRAEGEGYGLATAIISLK